LVELTSKTNPGLGIWEWEGSDNYFNFFKTDWPEFHFLCWSHQHSFSRNISISSRFSIFVFVHNTLPLFSISLVSLVIFLSYSIYLHFFPYSNESLSYCFYSPHHLAFLLHCLHLLPFLLPSLWSPRWLISSSSVFILYPMFLTTILFSYLIFPFGFSWLLVLASYF